MISGVAMRPRSSRRFEPEPGTHVLPNGRIPNITRPNNRLAGMLSFGKEHWDAAELANPGRAIRSFCNRFALRLPAALL